MELKKMTGIPADGFCIAAVLMLAGAVLGFVDWP